MDAGVGLTSLSDLGLHAGSTESDPPCAALLVEGFEIVRTRIRTFPAGIETIACVRMACLAERRAGEGKP
jgi:hypothetical protein